MQDDEDNGEENVENAPAEDEDMVAKTEPQFKTWQASLLAQTNCMRLLLKIADFLDTSRADEDEEDDEAFEDCDDDGAMEDDDESQPAQVIDMDA